MLKDLPGHWALLDLGDDSALAATHGTDDDVDRENPAEQLSPRRSG
jgi:hypothetical protein